MNLEPATAELNTADQIGPQRYTYDNGEYAPVIPDLLYPPETVFFVLDADGEFVPEGDAGLETTMPEQSRLDPVTITLEQMISTAVAFLEKQNFVVRHVSDMPKVSDKIERAALLGKLESVVSGNMTTHAAINEATTLISKLNELI